MAIMTTATGVWMFVLAQTLIGIGIACMIVAGDQAAHRRHRVRRSHGTRSGARPTPVTD